MLSEISTKKLSGIFKLPEVRLIDVRPVDAYNGWQLYNEIRGGHIPGAKSLPVKWLNYIDWIEIVRHKNILPDNKIIIYGYNRKDSESAAKRFLKSGYTNVSVYNYFIDEWIANQKLPLQKLHCFQHLVSAEWVNNLISGSKPAYYNNEHFVIVHAHYRNRDSYLSGHIPGAVDMDTLTVEAPETWNRRSPEELKKTFEEHGITADTTVILYGKFMHPDNNDPFPGSAAGDIAAIRCAFIMMYAGVKDVRILNGGFQSWEDAGYNISFADVHKKPVDNFGVYIPARPELAVDTSGAKEMIKSDNSELVCVRSWPEYIGEVSGYNYIKAQGRIPGAVFADCGSDAYHMENYRNTDHTTREFSEIKEMWKKNEITPDKHIAFYCGTGWRGSEAWFNAWLMGWPRVSVYDGGWFEWSLNPDNPIETGVPENYEREIFD